MKGRIKPMTLPADGKTRAFIDGGESARILKAPTEI
jgi:hypothetical protein